MAEFLDVSAADWRCSTYARAQDLDPIGSAGTYDCFFLVETPLPWPRDVSEIAALREAIEAVEHEAPDRSARVLAIVPTHDEPLVTHWWRDPDAPAGPYAGADHVVAPNDLAPTLAALARDPGAHEPVNQARRDVVICTHGRRDVCCGRAGTALFQSVRDRWEGVRVRRTSHTGGHRFAPTGFTFPEARAWAYLEPDLVAAIVERTGEPERLARHYRGWAALDAAAQVAERELLRRHGWRWIEAAVEAKPLAGIDPDSGTAGVSISWTLDGEAGSASAGVGIRRRVATLACGSPPDATTKTDPEYEIRSFHEGDGTVG
jgi:hypothetical protein